MTLEDVARVAKVSAATVSRVINSNPSISEGTANRVRAAIKELDYVPPPPEKRIRKRKGFPQGVKKGNVAFLVPDSCAIAIQTPQTVLLLDGISGVLGPLHVGLEFLKLAPTGGVPSSLTAARLDGVICKNWPKDPKVAAYLGRCRTIWCLGTPHRPESGDQVEVDPDTVADLAVSHLAAMGCEHVAILDCQPQELAQQVRAVALKQRVAAQQMALSEHPLDHARTETVARVLSAILSDNRRGKAKLGILLESAEWHYAAVNMELLRRGVQVGRDVELVCIAPSVDALPGLAAGAMVIDLAIRDLGACAAEMLLWRLANPKAAGRRLLIQPEMKRLGEGLRGAHE